MDPNTTTPPAVNGASVLPPVKVFNPTPAPVAPVTPPVQNTPAPISSSNESEGAAPVTTLKQIISYSKANPNSQYAKQAYTLIKNGSFDAQAAKEGIDLSWAGRPKLTASQGQDVGQDKGQPAAPKSTLGEMDMQQLQQAGQKIVDSIHTAGTKEAHDANGTVFGEAKGVGDVLEGLLGSGAGIVQGVSAPVTAVLQKLVEMDPAKLKEGAADPSLAGNPTEAAAAQFAAAHPELTQNIKDALTVGGALYGGAEGLIPGADMSLGDFAKTGKNMLEDAATRVKGGSSGLGDALVGADAKAPTAIKPGETAPVSDKKALPGVAASAVGQAVGVQPTTIQEIFQNPDKFTPEQMGQASRDSNADFVKEGINKKVQQLEQMKAGVTPRDLADQVQNGIQLKEQDLNRAAKEYGGITGDRTPGSTEGPNIKVAKNWLDKQVEKITGRKVTNGKIDTSPSSAAAIRQPKDINTIQKFLDTHRPAFQKGTLSGNEFLNIRDDMDTNLANFDTGGTPSTEVQKAGKALYGNFNDSYRGRFPGLEKADANYTDQKNDLDRLKVGLIDNQGNLSENALTRIRNATNGDKFDIGSKLEELAPGIKARVQKLKDIEDEQERYRAGIVDGQGKLLEGAANKIHNASGVGKDILSNRLEEVAPGIGNRVKFLKVVEDLKSATGIKAGTYGRALLSGGAMLGGPFGIAAWAMTHPDYAVPMLRKLGVTAGNAEKIAEDLGVATKK